MKHLLCFFRSPRNIYVAADGMECLYGQGADPVRTLVAIKPPFNVSSCELTNLTQFPIGKVIPGYCFENLPFPVHPNSAVVVKNPEEPFIVFVARRTVLCVLTAVLLSVWTSVLIPVRYLRPLDRRDKLVPLF